MAYTAIDNSSSFMSTKLYTGNASTNAITGVGFQPDLTWTKDRDATYDHMVWDAVRGATKRIKPNTTAAENDQSDGLTSFDSDGFTMGADNGNNASGDGFVSWNWKAGTTTGIAGSPSITPSSYSFNATSGFSIIKWTGTGANGTLPHGLGVVPKIYIVKNLDAIGKWWFFPSFLNDAAKYFDGFTSTGAIQTDGNGLTNSTLPTSSLISIGTTSTINISSDNIICYAFAEIAGYSKFDTYTGNGNADGAFVYTGFRPAWVMVKRTDSANDWIMFDNKRNTFNVVDNQLAANLTTAEDSGSILGDFLSNGFKLRNTFASRNASGGTYTYMAFAEAPFVNSNGVPCNAR